MEIVERLEDIPNADRIKVAILKDLAWEIVVKAGELKPGDFCVFIQIDTILPNTLWSEFLQDKKNPSKPIRIRAIKMRGQRSQGLVLPIKLFPELAGQTLEQGLDITNLLGIKHYEKPIPLSVISGLARGSFPQEIPMTDEINIKSVPGIIEEIKGKKISITQKCDGTSVTFANIKGDIHVCSRRLSIKEGKESLYWEMFHKYNLSKIFEHNADLAIQAEICGPGIQKNPLGLAVREMFVFDVYDIKNQKYFDQDKLRAFCEENRLPGVPLIATLESTTLSLNELKELANSKYSGGQPAEGIVVRTEEVNNSKTLETFSGRSRLSFKVMNDDYLETEE
jgi:RNA ligase (TIGR02306 family)